MAASLGTEGFSRPGKRAGIYINWPILSRRHSINCRLLPSASGQLCTLGSWSHLCLNWHSNMPAFFKLPSGTATALSAQMPSITTLSCFLMKHNDHEYTSTLCVWEQQCAWMAGCLTLELRSNKCCAMLGSCYIHIFTFVLILPGVPLHAA